MSEELSKSATAEMKRHGSRKEQQAAVSVQIGRIVDKLAERARGLDYGVNEDLSAPKSPSVRKNFASLRGPKEGQNDQRWAESSNGYFVGSDRFENERADATTTVSKGDTTVKSFLRKPRQEEATRVNLTYQMNRVSGSTKKDIYHNRTVEVDPNGKRKPIAKNILSVDAGPLRHDTYTPTTGQMVEFTAPALYEMKKTIDKAEADKADQKAA